jgi:hypothetical protein
MLNLANIMIAVLPYCSTQPILAVVTQTIFLEVPFGVFCHFSTETFFTLSYQQTGQSTYCNPKHDMQLQNNRKSQTGINITA